MLSEIIQILILAIAYALIVSHAVPWIAKKFRRKSPPKAEAVSSPEEENLGDETLKVLMDSLGVKGVILIQDAEFMGQVTELSVTLGLEPMEVMTAALTHYVVCLRLEEAGHHIAAVKFNEPEKGEGGRTVEVGFLQVPGSSKMPAPPASE